MPLLRGVARVAVILGRPPLSSNRVSRRQGIVGHRRTRSSSSSSVRGGARRRCPGGRPARAAQAARRLKAQGVLTDAEFEAQKAKILAGV